MAKPPAVQAEAAPKVGRCFHVRITKEQVHIKLARDFGIMVYTLLVARTREAVMDEPMYGDLDLLSLANVIENNLEMPPNSKIGILTLPHTCELELFQEQLQAYSAPDLWVDWQTEDNFGEDFTELALALDPIVESAPCMCVGGG